MDNKAWLWKRKSSLKNIEKERVLDLERSLEELKKKLSSVCIESNSKDDLLAKQAKVSDEAITGWQKAEAEALSLKQQLDAALLQKRTAEHALKECLQQLHVTKEDQQFIVNNAALKISREQEKIRSLEQRLVDTSQKLTESVVQNGNLNRIIEAKEHMLKESSESKSNLEAKLMEVMSRLDSSDKLIASLRYELCMLQKEIEIRNEEREYNHRSATAAHRQHLANIKKIAKLETECQRLRIMVRKRLPGPTALAKMRIEVEALETRKKRPSSTNEDFHLKDILLNDCYDLSSKGAVSLVDRLRTTEDENKILKESLTKKNNELQGSQIMVAHTASKLSQVEKQLEELSKREACSEPYDLPLSSISEHGTGDDTVSCNESWASALISELEHFKSGKPTISSCRSGGVSEYSLMDDSIEMEKPATVSGDNNSCVTTRGSRAGLDLSEATGSKSSTQLSPSNFEESVRKLTELVEGIRKGLDVPSGDGEADFVEQNSPANIYFTRTYLWETAEFAGVLQNFISMCNELLYRKVDLQRFAAQTASTLDWIVSHSFSLEDVLDLKARGRKCTEANESNSDYNELKAVIFPSKGSTTDDRKFPSLSALKSLFRSSRMDDVETKLKDENEQLKYEAVRMETKRKDLEEMLKTSNAENETLMVRLQELEANVSDLQLQLAAAKESKEHIEDQIINQKLINEDLGTQLAAAKAKLKEAHGKFLSLEVELEEKNNCCEELETTCLDLQLQIESALPKETPKLVLQQEEKRIDADCDIAAASAKLAACQETIVNLGKQLKVLASPRDAPLFDKVISSPATVKSKHRLQLVDHMRAASEDQTDPESPNMKEIICTEVPKAATVHGSVRSIMALSPEKSQKGVLMVAPKKQKGRGGFLRKLLLLQRRKSKV
ncbi:filament-like plant protein 7 [Curcuma longa]|uniref:filament-like plant protein 7 n=1 Tax=Curcuma longa TaxID=136217 RepID=UPI003D9E8A76